MAFSGGPTCIRPPCPAGDRGSRRGALHLGDRPEPVPLLLLRRCPQHVDELEGVLLRLLRPRQQHHPGQDPRLPVAAGALRESLRLPRVGPDAAPGDRGRAERPGALSGGAPLGRCQCRADRGGGLHRNPGRSRALPQRGRGRRVHAAAPAGGGRHPAGRPERATAPADHGRGLGRAGLPDQDAGGVGGATRAGPGLPGLRAHRAAPPADPPHGRRSGDGGGLRLLDADRHPHAGQGPALRGRHHQQLGLQHGRGLQLPEPLLLARDQRGRHGQRDDDHRGRRRRHGGVRPRGRDRGRGRSSGPATSAARLTAAATAGDTAAVRAATAEPLLPAPALAPVPVAPSAGAASAGAGAGPVVMPWVPRTAPAAA